MKKRILITGGAGFIGANAVAHYLKKGWAVSVFDNLSRKGTRSNLAWLRRQGLSDFIQGDLRNRTQISRWVKKRSAGLRIALHLGAQVAVTTSVIDPMTDFNINALGSVHFLEALRKLRKPPLTLYSSTNKVYGGMESVRVKIKNGRYTYVGLPFGASEKEPLDFHSPYGCSKGAADQYFRDYSRIYGMGSVVFRQSCIYGPHQNGNEDQGWIAHFMKAALAGKEITLYGNGRQVRDVLFVSDLLDAFDAGYRRGGRTAGSIYNIGGGAANTLSLLELIAWIEKRQGRRLRIKKRGWRPGDQRVFVSDIRKAEQELRWKPRTSVPDGLEHLWNWLRQDRP